MTVALLDAYNLLYRSFTSLPAAITGADGQPINAVYGMLSSIVRLKREFDPVHFAAAFDRPEVPTFRRELFSAYQAQRGPLGGDQAEDFQRQVAIAADVLPRLGIPAISVPTYEADDVMGTLATSVAAAGDRALLVSTDRDLLQLVGHGIEILVPGKVMLEIRTPDEARARIGVFPFAVTTFKALAGDASDNIPGLPGIGVKTAVRLIDELGRLDEIYQRIDETPGRIRTLLEQNRENAYLYQRVATIRTDLDLGLSPGDLPPFEVSGEDRARALLGRHGY